jgi:ankyrin repeat protein
MSNAYNRLTPQFEALFSQSNLADIQYTDVDGNNVVHLAAYCGQIDTLQTILNKYGSQLNLETENNDGETAMTLAIKKQGFHKTMAILHQQGAKIPSSRRKLLQQYALNNGYTITAKWLSSKFDGL